MKIIKKLAQTQFLENFHTLQLLIFLSEAHSDLTLRAPNSWVSHNEKEKLTARIEARTQALIETLERYHGAQKKFTSLTRPQLNGKIYGQTPSKLLEAAFIAAFKSALSLFCVKSLLGNILQFHTAIHINLLFSIHVLNFCIPLLQGPFIVRFFTPFKQLNQDPP